MNFNLNLFLLKIYSKIAKRKLKSKLRESVLLKSNSLYYIVFILIDC